MSKDSNFKQISSSGGGRLGRREFLLKINIKVQSPREGEGEEEEKRGQKRKGTWRNDGGGLLFLWID